MKARDFLQLFDDARIVQAIKDAEQTTSGEIRVYVSYRKRDVAIMERAAARFEKLGMAATRDRNAVLLYFAPEERQFAVIGDAGMHQKCGSGLWEEIAGDLREHFSRGNFTEAVVGVIQKTGAILTRHFPRRPDDRDELPNDVLRD